MRKWRELGEVKREEGGEGGREREDERIGWMRGWIDRRRRRSNGGPVTQRLWQHVPPYSPNSQDHNANLMMTRKQSGRKVLFAEAVFVFLFIIVPVIGFAM